MARKKEFEDWMMGINSRLPVKILEQAETYRAKYGRDLIPTKTLKDWFYSGMSQTNAIRNIRRELEKKGA